MTDEENYIVATSFVASYRDQVIEMTLRIILDNLLRSWNEDKSSLYPSTHSVDFSEFVLLNILSI